MESDGVAPPLRSDSSVVIPGSSGMSHPVFRLQAEALSVVVGPPGLPAPAAPAAPAPPPPAQSAGRAADGGGDGAEATVRETAAGPAVVGGGGGGRTAEEAGIASLLEASGDWVRTGGEGGGCC